MCILDNPEVQDPLDDSVQEGPVRCSQLEDECEVVDQGKLVTEQWGPSRRYLNRHEESRYVIDETDL